MTAPLFEVDGGERGGGAMGMQRGYYSSLVVVVVVVIRNVRQSHAVSTNVRIDIIVVVVVVTHQGREVLLLSKGEGEHGVEG